MNKIEITNVNDVANDVSSLVNHIASLSAKDKEWLSKVYFREVIKSKHYSVQSQDELATHVNYVGSQELLDNARYIVDWLAGLQERDPKQHSKLPRITFQQALGHSKKWHAELAKKAEQSDRYIEPDAENGPKVLDLGDGWEVYWLKTNVARDVEGDVMGHCVGSGAYDELDDGAAVFSIRKNNVAHITLHMDQLYIEQAVTKGNDDVPERYQHLVDESAAKIGVRLYLGRKVDDTSDIDDGWHEISNRDKIHIQNGMLNSAKNDAAIIYADGTQEWWVDGKRHREDGPAVIGADGSQFWYQNSLRHREDGPAVIYTNGRQEWWLNGRRHKDDGPAVIKANGYKAWWLNGRRHKDDGPAVIHPDGSQEWWMQGKLHREGAPAIVKADGYEGWYLDNKRHREDGPAVIEANGMKQWWVDDNLHREDGPAIIQEDGTQEWYEEGKRHRDDGPAVIYPDSGQEWWVDDKRHREDGPAVIRADGIQEWYQNDKRHRLDGPAINYESGRKEWWVDGEKYTEEKFNKITTNMISTSANP